MTLTSEETCSPVTKTASAHGKSIAKGGRAMPRNTGTKPDIERADLMFRNGHTFRNVDRLDELRWTVLGASSDIERWQEPKEQRA